MSGDGKRLVTNSGGNAPRVWQVNSKESESLTPTTSPVHGLAMTPDGLVIAGAAESCLRLWNAQTGVVIDDYDGPEEIITTVACSADGQFLASGSSLGTAVWVWRVTDHKPVLIIPDPLHNCTVESLAFHPSGRFLAIAGIDWLATGGSSGGVSVWDMQERCEVAVFSGGATSVAFHPDGRRLACTTTEQAISLWELRTQELQGELTGHDGAVACLAFSPDGKWLISGGEDRTLRVWTDDGAEHSFHEVDSQITGLAFTADSQIPIRCPRQYDMQSVSRGRPGEIGPSDHFAFLARGITSSRVGYIKPRASFPCAKISPARIPSDCCRSMPIAASPCS